MISRRKIIRIDTSRCTGCGLCVPDCPEGALQIIDGKARLISDLFCDGLGACIGTCPEDAISIEEREAEPYDEKRVMENIVKAGTNTIKAHLAHLKDHGETKYLREAVEYLRENKPDFPAHEFITGEHKHGVPHGCPGSQVISWDENKRSEPAAAAGAETGKRPSQLRQWPVQLMLVNPLASYLEAADLLIAADCVPFAYADFHRDFLKGKTLVVGCPKLDDAEHYREKLTNIFKTVSIKSVTVVNMEVPCCFGLRELVKGALKASGKKIPYCDITVSIKGGLKEE
ncbi:MAG TPA: 4Fe-4S binding protein [bacterium]|nr:4Fe-4S binding protein [bacterium]